MFVYGGRTAIFDIEGYGSGSATVYSGGTLISYLDIAAYVYSGATIISYSDYESGYAADVRLFGGVLDDYAGSTNLWGSGDVALYGGGTIHDEDDGAVNLTTDSAGGTLMYADDTIVDGTGGGVLDVALEDGSIDVVHGTVEVTSSYDSQATVESGATLIVASSDYYSGYSEMDVTLDSGGTLDIESDTVVLESDSTGGDVTVESDGTLDLAGNSVSIDSLTGDGIVTNSSTSDATLTVGASNASSVFSGTIEEFVGDDGYGHGTVGLTKTGSGTLTLTGDNTYTGVTTISGGTLQLGDGTAANGSLAGDIVDNATLAFANHTDLTYAGDVSGSGAVTKTGAGVMTLSGDLDYSGTTTVGVSGAAASLALSGDNAITGTITINSGSALKAVSRDALGNSAGLLGSGTLDLDFSSLGVAADLRSFSGSVENQQNPMTPDGIGGTPPVDPAAETTPLSSLSGARYFDGTVTIVGAALAPDVSSFWSQQPIWTNNPLLLTGSNGNNVTSADQPELFQFDATHLVVTDANSGTWFSYNSSTGAYTQQYASDSTLSYNSTTGKFTFTDSLGDTETFFGFSNSLPAIQHGQMADFTNSGGEELVYSYNTSGANVGRVATVTLKQDSTTIRQAVYTYYQGTHTGDDEYGNLNDLKLVQINDASGNLIDQTYYRYYTSSSSTSYVGGLQFMFSLDSYLRLQAAFSGSDIDTLTASQIQNYADVALQYDPTSHDVTQVISQGLGCSACDAGLGTYDYSYAVNADCDNGFNTWKYETTETQPDGSANIVFANYQGETLFTVHADSVAHAAGSSSAPKWMTFDHYDFNGRLIDEAEPSAVSGYSLTGDTLSVTLNTGSGLVEQTDYYTTSGAITANNSTSLGSSSHIGGINGYVEDYAVKKGWSGTEVLKEAFQYYLDTPAGSGTALVAPLATDTVYAGTGNLSNPFDGTTGSPETTKYAYTLSSTDTAITSETVTLPSTTADEASGSGDTTTTFDAFGRPVWTQDAAGYLDYFQYDAATGSMTEMVQDVNTSTGIPSGSLEASTLPSGWTTPTGGGLNLVTTDIVDALGRTTEETDPSMRATFTIYNDALHETRTYAGWTDNGIVSGHESYTQQSDPPPTEVEIDDLTFTTTVSGVTYGNSYFESFTMSAAAATDGTTGAPTGGETIADIQSLSVSLTNTAGQVVEQHDYFALPSFSGDISGTYASSTLAAIDAGAAWDKSAGTGNYYVTTYQYDHLGDLDKTVSPDGTIDRTVYDTLGREVSTWVGTDDTPTSGYWSPTNLTGTNMVQLTATTYDNGGVGDSNVTGQLSFPDGASTSNVQDTAMFYDWQDQLVATKSGILLNSDTSENLSGELTDGTNRPLVVDTLDNLGDVTEEDTYNGNDVSVDTSSGSAVFTIAATSSHDISGLLRAKTTALYDEQGRAYQTSVYAVTQSGTYAGAVYSLTSTPNYSDPEVSSTAFDPRGLVIATNAYSVDSTGSPLDERTTTYAFDGAGRMTTETDPDPSTGEPMAAVRSPATRSTATAMF